MSIKAMTAEEHEMDLKERWKSEVSGELTELGYAEWKATQFKKWRVSVDRTEVRSKDFEVMAYSADQAADLAYGLAVDADFNGASAGEPEYEVSSCEEVDGE